MRKHGRVVRWNAERGFGFLRAADSQADVFFHVRDVRGGEVREGLDVIYEEIHVGGKGPRGMAVRPLARTDGTGLETTTGAAAAHHGLRSGRAATASPDPGRSMPRARAPARRGGDVRPRPTNAAAQVAALLPLAAAYAVLLVWAAWTRRLPTGLVLASPLLNAATFWVYWNDKAAARQGGWRTREDHLHALSLAGGWIGAGIAQALLRHKSRKASFRAGWWTTVALHGALLLGWLAWRGGAAG